MSSVLLTASQNTEQSVTEPDIQLELLEQTVKHYLRELHSPEVLDKGIVFIPRAVKYIYKEFGITITEFIVLERLLIHWYQHKQLPEISLHTLAQELGKSKIQVWRHLKKLQEKGFLMIIHIFGDDGGQHQNRYDIYPFIMKLEAYIRQQCTDMHDQKDHAPAQDYVSIQDTRIAPTIPYRDTEQGVSATTKMLPPLQQQDYTATAQPIELTASMLEAELLNDPSYNATPFTVEATPEPTPIRNKPSMGLLPLTPIPPVLQHDEPEGAIIQEPTPIPQKSSCELPPPALGPKTQGSQSAGAFETTPSTGNQPASDAEHAPKVSSQETAHTEDKHTESAEPGVTAKAKAKKTKSARTAKSNKKQESQSTPANHALDSREAARKLVEIYTHADLSPLNPQAQQAHQATGMPVKAQPGEEEAAGSTTETNIASGQSMQPTSTEKKKVVLSARVIEYMRACVDAFPGGVLDTTSAYKILTRIYKKMGEIQHIIDCTDEDIEADFMAMLEDVYDYTHEEIRNNPDNPPDALLFFLDALDGSVDALRINVSDEWLMAVLEEHENQFQREQWGIPEARPLTMHPREAIKKPMALFTLQQNSYTPPRGGQLLARMRHYGIKLERKQESNLLGNYPDPRLLDDVQGVLRMEQFRDEQNQIKAINIWLINGNTLDAFWHEHSLQPVKRTRNKRRTY